MSKHKRLSNIDSVRVIKVVKIKSIVGLGTEENPIRQITEYFNLKGKRLARTDYIEKVENIHVKQKDSRM
ncbi:MAG TPA: hypothetical protein ENI23_17250 [bacterium]|nr:hypothetical protein [bacterium]